MTRAKTNQSNSSSYNSQTALKSGCWPKVNGVFPACDRATPLKPSPFAVSYRSTIGVASSI